MRAIDRIVALFKSRGKKKQSRPTEVPDGVSTFATYEDCLRHVFETGRVAIFNWDEGAQVYRKEGI